MIVDAYHMDIYCDVDVPIVDHETWEHNKHYCPEQIITCTRAGAIKVAKFRGWKIKGNLCICPRCAASGKTWKDCKRDTQG